MKALVGAHPRAAGGAVQPRMAELQAGRNADAATRVAADRLAAPRLAVGGRRARRRSTPSRRARATADRRRRRPAVPREGAARSRARRSLPGIAKHVATAAPAARRGRAARAATRPRRSSPPRCAVLPGERPIAPFRPSARSAATFPQARDRPSPPRRPAPLDAAGREGEGSSSASRSPSSPDPVYAKQARRSCARGAGTEVKKLWAERPIAPRPILQA